MDDVSKTPHDDDAETRDGDEEEIDVPPSGWKVKAWFAERPSDAVRLEILQHIRDGHPTYTCKYHTHTPPPPGARVEYIDEFHVRQDRPMAPCPCCSPTKPKFRGRENSGAKIGWFPDEGVIRLIGPDCFASLNSEGHAEAVVKLREVTERRRTINYLVNKGPEVPKALAAIKNNLAIAEAFEKARAGVHKALQDFRVPLWENIREGVLYVNKSEEVVEKGEDGKDRTTLRHTTSPYATIAGVEFFAAGKAGLARRLKEAADLLSAIDMGNDHMRFVAEASDFERARFAKMLESGIDKARRATEELRHMRQGLSGVTLSTLRTWGGREDAQCYVYIARDGRDLLVGNAEENRTRIKQIGDVWNDLRDLPNLGKVKDVKQ